MGWVVMSERELNRVEVLSQVLQGRITATASANVLGLSRRQGYRLLKTFQSDGPATIRHKSCGLVMGQDAFTQDADKIPGGLSVARLFRDQAPQNSEDGLGAVLLRLLGFLQQSVCAEHRGESLT